MLSIRKILAVTGFIATLALDASSQVFPPFDIAAYKQFLQTNQNMLPEQLRTMYPAGMFEKKASTNFTGSLYANSIASKYNLTNYERQLIDNNGFMVSERLKSQSFGKAFGEIFHADLPVFFSTDAMLHAIHMSYDAILKDMEEGFLTNRLIALLKAMHDQVPALAARYAGQPAMKQSLLDIDLYLTVPRKLLTSTAVPVFSESYSTVDSVLAMIRQEKPIGYKLFSSTEKNIDFSQFTIRGHYTQTETLKKYFQAMMWLGRTEMYLIAPLNSYPPQTDSDIRRQTVDAALVAEAVQAANASAKLEEIDSFIRFFVGESDNVTLPNIRTLLTATNTDSASQLLNVNLWKTFQDTLKQKSYAFQRILSQIIISDPTNPDDIRPASSFLLLGQRFIIDSYITGNVVYDKIKFNGLKVWRDLPSSLDILFSLGNSASAQLLGPALSKYHYASNLAALRYLVDSYDNSFWNSTLYNNWLNSIRTLSPPSDRTTLPKFMQTAAWWQEKMNTQLASWAQLRHDNLLYAKQSYTGGVVCSFPQSYVEPIPEFYLAVKTFAASAAYFFQSMSSPDPYIAQYWNYVKNIADTLHSISTKELSKTNLTDAEKGFMQRMLYLRGICGPEYDGWYYRIYYTGSEGFDKLDLVAADVHTCPTDETGGLVGWILHGGTGPVNMAVITTEVSDGSTVSFIGPVMSYYEYVSTNFKRLTDEEWKAGYQLLPAYRPDFVNIYLADSLGNSRGDGPSLLTAVSVPGQEPTVPFSLKLGQNYPNPFNSSTVIHFSVPQSATNTWITITIYDVQGKRVKGLLNEVLPAGNFAVRWDGLTDGGSTAASGMYFYHLTAGAQRLVGKMNLIK